MNCCPFCNVEAGIWKQLSTQMLKPSLTTVFAGGMFYNFATHIVTLAMDSSKGTIKHVGPFHDEWWHDTSVPTQ